MSSNNDRISLRFAMFPIDGWPPISEECLPFRRVEKHYEALEVPLFVKDLSVGDIISAKIHNDEYVIEWKHVLRSRRSTVWLLRLQETQQIHQILEKFRMIGCNTASLEAAGCYGIDVPEALSMGEVDAILATLDSQFVAVAFPSIRHAT